MRLYYEAHENVKDMETEPELVRVDVTDMADTEKRAVLADIKDIMSGKDYRLVSHQCGHEDGLRCEMEAI